MTVTGNAILAGVIGWPVKHSLSPVLHGHWLAAHDIDGAYVPLAVAPDDLEGVLRTLPRMGFAGVNLTVPHKEAALRIVDDADDRARRVGAVNTVVIDADGRLNGGNTDVYGFLENLHAGKPDWDAAAGPAVVLGAGGAARAVCSGLIDEGAPEIRVVNRTAARAQTLAQDIGGAISVVSWDDRAEALAGAELLVNTTSLGMTGQPELDLDLENLPADAVVNDIVYNPLKTSLLAVAAARGNPVVDGLGMLLYQARPGFTAWFGIEPEVTDELRAAVLAALGR